MTSLERFMATIERRPVDRPASWLGDPTEAALPGLLAYFGVDSLPALKERLGDDIHEVDIPYHSPVSDHIAAAFPFAKQGIDPETGQSYEERTLTAPGFFEDYSDPGAVDLFEWPDPADHIDREACRETVASAPPGKAVMAMAWSAHFQDACAAFGMETALVKLMIEPEMFRAVIDRIVAFYLRANEIFYESAGDGLHAVLIGNDFGTQTGLLIDPVLLREFVIPGTRRLIDQAHDYGLKVIHHSCGSVLPVIEDLIRAGADAIHPIQALAVGMQAEGLAVRFAGKTSFCGGVDAQFLLVRGTPKEVYDRVTRLIELMPTGLILSPSHEAILPDTKPQNIEAMFAAVKDATQPARAPSSGSAITRRRDRRR